MDFIRTKIESMGREEFNKFLLDQNLGVVVVDGQAQLAYLEDYVELGDPNVRVSLVQELVSFHGSVMAAWYDRFDARHDVDPLFVYKDETKQYIELPIDLEIHEVVLKTRE